MRQLASDLSRHLPVLLPLLAGVTSCFIKAVQTAGLASLPWILFAVAMIVLAGIVFSFPFAHFLTIPFGRINFPPAEGTPDPAYRLAE